VAVEALHTVPVLAADDHCRFAVANQLLQLLLPGDKLDIKEGPQGLFIPGLRVEAVGGADDVVAVLQKGKQHRSTFATNMNEHSSRSHLVLTIYVKGYDSAKGELATVIRPSVTALLMYGSWFGCSYSSDVSAAIVVSDTASLQAVKK
jgi:hypothetical protein